MSSNGGRTRGRAASAGGRVRRIAGKRRERRRDSFAEFRLVRLRRYRISKTEQRRARRKRRTLVNSMGRCNTLSRGGGHEACVSATAVVARKERVVAAVASR